MELTIKTYKVSELHDEITNILEQSYLFPLSIEGEITSFRGANSSGHYYFNLKDNKASISCVLFKYSSQNSTSLPEMGKKVKITGNLKTYSNASSPSKYQIIVTNIEELSTVGDLYKKYLELRDKLDKEGLFDNKFKNQQFISYPKKIGIITSKTGEVIHDIQKTIKQRFPFIKIMLYPVRVQGDGAAVDIIKALDYFEKKSDIQTIILGRGGGSFENLFCFNNEELVRKIFSSKKQIISSVGHDKDTPICDLVADLRASTPTQAATLVTPITFENIIQNLDKINSNINYYINKQIEDNHIYLDQIFGDITNSLKNKIDKYKTKLDYFQKHINSLSYTSILGRGFSITTNKKGEIIKNKDQIVINGKIITQFLDFKIESEIKTIK